MDHLSNTEDKIRFLEELQIVLQRDILYNCSIAGINPEELEITAIDMGDYIASLPVNISEVQHFAFVSVARSVNKLNLVNQKLKELYNA